MENYNVSILVFLACVIILVGCSDDEASNNQEEDNGGQDSNAEANSHSDANGDNESNNNTDDRNDDVEIETDDGEVTFTLKNEIDASDEEMEVFEERALDAYDVVVDSIDTPYTPQDEINIRLMFSVGIVLMGTLMNGNSYGDRVVEQCCLDFG